MLGTEIEVMCFKNGRRSYKPKTMRDAEKAREWIILPKLLEGGRPNNTLTLCQ